METQFGFTKYSLDEFKLWLGSITLARTVTFVQEHHTWRPSYASFDGSNHFALQRGMKRHHVDTNGWGDIGQHFTIFPDGAIMTGRPLASSPACIYGNNSRSICIENLGDFDTGQDAMTQAQADSIVGATAAILARFNWGAPTVNNIVYHHWFDLNTGARTDGTGVTKTCPGTGFFGGNSVNACRTNFLPLVQAALTGLPASPVVVATGYVSVTANSLTIRTGPGADNPAVPGVAPAQLGSILRVYAQQSGWIKISSSNNHWVSDSRTVPVRPARINTPNTNCRSGPAATFPVVRTLQQGEQVFEYEASNGWSRVGLDDAWIRSTLLTFGA